MVVALVWGSVTPIGHALGLVNHEEHWLQMSILDVQSLT